MKNIIITFIVQLFYTTIFSQISGPIPVQATEANPFGGGLNKALLYIDYVGTDFRIRKPLIVFEGYDPGYYTKPKEKEGRTD